MLRNPLDPEYAKEEIQQAVPHLKWETHKVSLPRLFKQSKLGKTQVWDIFLELIDESGNIVQVSPALLTKRLKPKLYSVITTRFGQLDGKLQDAPVEIPEGKNIGRSNETNVFSQGVLEMISDWTRQQKRKGYTSTETAITHIRPRPMLLDKYTQYKNYIDFSEPVFVQEKLDGVRVLVHWDPNRRQWVITSREGNEYCHLNHIKSELNKVPYLKQHPNIYLDGELFSREVNFNKIVSLCKKVKQITPEEQEEQKYIKFYVFDMFDLDKPKLPFIKRLQFYQQILDASHKYKYLVPLKTIRVHSDKEVQDFHKKVIEYSEGTVIRQGSAPYLLGKRSKYALKLKDFQDAEFEITGFTDGRGKEKGLIIFILKTPEGKEFSATPNMPNDERSRMFKHGKDFIGKLATVKFFEMTPDKVPRFGKVIAIRDYE